MLIIPKDYKSTLNIRETQRAIAFTRKAFEKRLCAALNLERVSAPLFVASGEGINDDLNGIERAVSFDIPSVGGREAQVVHSLAKWKRIILKEYGFNAGEGIYSNMNAIRRDEELDNIHSIYVDQWDWEKVINKEDRTEEYLKNTVSAIVNAMADTLDDVKKEYPAITLTLNRKVAFITAQELEDKYPHLTPKEREDAFTKENKTVFIMKIGDKLNSGKPHDGRAPDYDDWQLNGDILLWNELLGISYEISSMGIRVDEKSLAEQLEKSGYTDRAALKYHSLLLGGKLPPSIGGGIGQSRLCMLMLQKAHLGEVHASVWSKEMWDECAKNGINLL
ncbi:MAG: aspartate--ammonia ligase [Clostridia bacterium]